jgi:hypothetical protein
MEEKVFEFLLESQSLMLELDKLIDKYGLRDQAVACVIQGVIVPDPEDEDMGKLTTVYNLTAEGQSEVDTIKSFVQDIWDSMDEGDDLDDLLSGTGISLN